MREGDCQVKIKLNSNKEYYHNYTCETDPQRLFVFPLSESCPVHSGSQKSERTLDFDMSTPFFSALWTLSSSILRCTLLTLPKEPQQTVSKDLWQWAQEWM